MVKGTRCLELDELVYKNHLTLFLMKCMVRKVFQQQNIMIHTNMPQNCVIFLTYFCELTGSGNLTPQNGVPCQFTRYKENPAISRHYCVIIILYFQNIFPTMHFITNSFQTLLIDQLARSKATCSFTRTVSKRFNNVIGL